MNAQTMIDANGRNFDADCSSMCLFIIMAQLALIEPNIERRKLNRNFSKAIKLTDMLCILFIS